MQTVSIWKCRHHELCFTDRPLLMGILNVTPDSFSDGGLFLRTEDAVSHAREMVENGADIIDVGGESTRPGAAAVSQEDELKRVIPVIEALSSSLSVPISVDTMKSAVARRAVMAGASIVNDVSAGTNDSELLSIAAKYGCGVVLMHKQGDPRTMQQNPVYDDVVREVGEFMAARVAAAVSSGIKRECIAVDPGIGFGKRLEHNLALLRATREFSKTGQPLLIGLSRKRFLEQLTGRSVDQRMAGSLAALVYCVLEGAAVMRVHDVAESRDAVSVAMALSASAGAEGGE